MDSPTSPNKNCGCSPALQATRAEQPVLKVKKTYKSIPSILLSVGIAFFPKCPLCWAAYMSMFGSFGLSNLPYMGWLLPVLVGFLGLHLYLIFRKTKKKGYGPFVISVLGAVIILGGRMLFPLSKPVLFLGMLLVLTGSLWNSFSIKPIKQLSPTV